MLNKPLINADSLILQDEANSMTVFKKPVPFLAINKSGEVEYFKLDDSNKITSKRGRKVPMATFMTSFSNFGDEKKPSDDFKRDVFYFCGVTGPMVNTAVQISEPFYITDNENNEFIHGSAGDYLVENSVGELSIVASDDFGKNFMMQEEYNKAVSLDAKPALNKSQQKEADFSL